MRAVRAARCFLGNVAQALRAGARTRWRRGFGEFLEQSGEWQDKEKVDGGRNEDESDHGIQKIAVSDFAAVNGEDQCGKIRLAHNGGQQRIDNVLHQRIDDGSEGRADYDGDSKVNYVATQKKIAESFDHGSLLREEVEAKRARCLRWIVVFSRKKRKGFVIRRAERLCSFVLPPTIPQVLLQTPVLIQAGWHDSGPQHWQTHWANALGPRARRIAHDDWHVPVRSRWIEEAQTALDAEPEPVLFVAHSLGCPLTAYLGQIPSAASKIAAAFLVAPADIEREGAAIELQKFAPIPRERMPFPAMVAASSDDPYCHLERAREFADAWDAQFVNIGHAGHIAGPPNYGPWPEGLQLLAKLATRERVG